MKKRIQWKIVPAFPGGLAEDNIYINLQQIQYTFQAVKILALLAYSIYIFATQMLVLDESTDPILRQLVEDHFSLFRIRQQQHPRQPAASASHKLKQLLTSKFTAR